MPPEDIRFAVFTKPWPLDSVEELADRVLDLGFDGAEIPVRPGFQVAPGKRGEGAPCAGRTVRGPAAPRSEHREHAGRACFCRLRRRRGGADPRHGAGHSGPVPRVRGNHAPPAG